MTDSMNFGPDWIRNLSSEGSTGGGASGGTRYQLADFRYGREEMLALFDRNAKPPASLTNFKSLYSEASLSPLALLPTSDEDRGWQGRPTTLSGPSRGRGGSLERGGRIGRGRGNYQYGRATAYESGWGNGEQPDWSPRKEYSQRTMSSDNWRRARNNEEDDGWRNVSQGRSSVHEKWGRSTSWRGEGDSEERSGPPERGSRTSWHDLNRAPPSRRSWDEEHLPEWATENPTEGGGTFDERGAFHGSDDEQMESMVTSKRDTGLQKSTSQQHISSKSQHPPLSSSKSTMSLINKSEDHTKKKEEPPKEYKSDDPHQSKENGTVPERKKSVPNIPEKVDKEVVVQERAKSEGPPKPNEKQPAISNGPIQDQQRNEESDFERLQEDFVLKLVVDEEPPKQTPNAFDVGGIQPPPNLLVPVHDKWFYQDPQGQMQGPFTYIEMAEWYKAGYFSNQLKVKRQVDERFFLLGELITMCGGANPFQAGIRFPTLKNDISKMPDPDILQFQYLSQMAAYKQAQARIMAEPWSALTLQQQELAAQRLIMQQQQVPQDLQYMQQPPATNPLMHMINQMQQGNKLPGQGLVDKPPQNMPSSMDPQLQMHMGNILSLQNRMQNAGISNHLPSNLPGSLPPETLSSSMPSLQSAALNTGGLPLPGLHTNMPASLGGSISMPRPTSHGSVDQLGPAPDNDPISNLLKQLQQKQQTQQIDSLWQQNQFGVANAAPPQQQWQTQPEVPLTMWDIQQSNAATPPTVPEPQPQAQQPKPQVQQKAEKEPRPKEETTTAKELKKKKEQDEKQAKKEAEEKRKQEQRKQEAERKVMEEKKRKEEEKVKKELEKAKREAEEKRLKELEEKRRLKEQRKAEEEAKKKSEEARRLEEERLRQEVKEMESRRQAEERRIQQEQIRIAKAAPWSQSNSTLGMSLADIQKAEREKRAQEAAALQVQRLQEKEYQQQQQQQQEKQSGIQLSWAKKPVEPRKVKSLAEIQAEEQERLAKQAAESRLQKEKEAPPVSNNTGSIWNSQNLTWANASSNSQWSSNSGGFWDDPSHKQAATKPSTVSKSNSTSAMSAASKQQAQKQQPPKAKAKKEEAPKVNHNNSSGGAPSADEFTNWCYKTLSNITTSVDIPTFVTFLRDIESAFDVREYCKEYLGESTATQQFASNFLEKRRSFKPKNNAHKDDMCSPAPAITPSLQHSTEFQEVKGKNKKNKKSKMLKVDSRILGFNVTSAPDRINVGDRDYGDNS